MSGHTQVTLIAAANEIARDKLRYDKSTCRERVVGLVIHINQAMTTCTLTDYLTDNCEWRRASCCTENEHRYINNTCDVVK